MTHDTLTPERITQLRGLGAYQGGLLKAELDALLDAAEELHAIENRAEKPTCNRCIKVRVHSLEDDRDRLAEEIASLRERVAELEVGHGTTSIRPVFPIQSEDMP